MATIGVKAIKMPKFNARAIERAILKEKRNKGKDIERQLNKTISGWSGDKPKFKARVKDRGKDVVIEITLTGSKLALDKWRWLDEGTRKDYPIPRHPKTGRATLWFADTTDSPYRAGTKPGSFASVPAVQSSGPMHAPKQVIHPGIEARGWTKMIREMMEDTFGKRIKIVLRRVIEKGK